MSTAPRTLPSSTSADAPAPYRAIGPARIAIAAVAGVVIDLLALWIGSASGATLVIDAPYPINALTVAAFSALPVILAAVVVDLVARRRPGFAVFAAWAGAGLALLSAVMPFVASSDRATSVTLASMHLVIGAVWFATVRPRPAA